MAKSASPSLLLVLSTTLLLLLAEASSRTPEAKCKPSGVLHGSGGHDCDECCKAGESYTQWRCSPPISSRTKAILTLNDFSEGGDGGGPSECDNSYHDNSEHVVALSTGWYSGGSRCGNSITIYANGRQVTAKVVDECDSINGCDKTHAFEPPCLNNIVDASSSVWKALGVSENDDDYGYMDVHWSLN